MRQLEFKKKQSFKFLSVILAAVFMFVFLTAGVYADGTTSTGTTGTTATLNEVRQILKQNYVDVLPDDVLNKPTVEDIIAEINKTDPYTTYFLPQKFDDFVNSINNTFTGIGVYIEIVPEGVKVTSVIEGAPAQSAGIKPGDIIMMADDHILTGLPDDVATGYIKGPENSTVKLRILRGSEHIDMDVVRKKINAPTVVEKVVDNHIGYIQIVSFGEDTASKFTQAVKDLKSKNVSSYVIDLRFNPGGYLDAALDIAGHFVGNDIALLTRDRFDGLTKYPGVSHGSVIDKPIIFLVNEYSASASEVLSGAVKDYGKAYFVGTKTYGKGCVQTTTTLSNGDTLKYTIQDFFSPKGNVIQKVGISPDLYVPDEIDSLRTAELIFDSPKSLKDTKGYVRVKLNKGEEATVALSRAKTPDYWPAYQELLSTTGSAISIGNGKGWTAAPKDYAKNAFKYLYTGYRELKEIKSANVNSAFTVQFDAKVLKSSINDKNIELFDAATGAKVPVKFTVSSSGKEIKVSSKSNLLKGNTYYLVVHPTVRKYDNKPMNYGMINKIETIKK